MPNINATNINQTSFRGLIEGLAFPANYYEYFEIELWDANATTFYYANNWTDSSSVNYYSYTDFSGLAASTTYTIKGFVKSSGGSRTFVGSTTVTTASPPLPLPGGVGNIYVTSHDTSLDISWGSASNASWYDLTVRVGNSSGSIVYTNGSLYSTSATVSGLASGTTYWIQVQAGNSTGNGTASTTTATTTTPPPPPSAVTGLTASPTTNSVTLSWSAASGATGYTIKLFLQGTSTLVTSTTSTGTSVTIGGLSPNTTYTAEVYGTNAQGSGASDFENFATTSNRPSNWAWTSLVSSIPFSSTYLVNGVRKGNLVTATDWNNFTTRINAFRTYKNLAAFTFTQVGSQQSMTPAIYNEAVNAITPMKTVSQPSGYYSKLIALRDALNSIT